MKKIYYNVSYWLEINLILILGHLFAFVGFAFNDTGLKYYNFIDLVPLMLKVLSILIIGSIILGISYKKKKDFDLLIYGILQLIVIFLWGICYVNSYM